MDEDITLKKEREPREDDVKVMANYYIIKKLKYFKQK